MSRATMAAAAATLPRAPIYGIGTYSTGSSVADFEIGWDELERDTEWAHSMMIAAGIKRGDLVLFSAPNHENPWITPIVRALRRIAAPYATAETYGWDARRFSMYLRRLPVKAIVGLSAETVDALTDTERTLHTLLSERRRCLGAGRRTPQARRPRHRGGGIPALGPGARLGNARGTRCSRQCRRMGRLEPRGSDPGDEQAGPRDAFRLRGHRRVRDRTPHRRG